MSIAKPACLFTALAFALSATAAPAQTDPAQAASAAADAAPDVTVGGAAMDPAAPISQNIGKSADHSELVKVLAASGIDLAAAGPFTLFAADNGAFGRLAPGTVDTLLKPENKETLVKVINYQVVPGALTIDDIRKQAEANGGTATLTTVEGQTFAVTFEDGAIKLTDANGNPAYVAQGDVKNANGVFHVINGVLLPKL
ncbi:fasciclin domain-containing protein [Sphingomonas flavalba]|uniref:fasciclin domain-containing protein n=1 Tax=Sphingomonas flavalba TaxID=2559804 RepID=UPI0039E140B7